MNTEVGKPNIEAEKPNIEAEKPNIEAEKPNIEVEKPNIEAEKPNIEAEKPNIENSFTAKVASHVCKLLDEHGFQTTFGRSDIQEILGLKSTQSSVLIKEMAEKGFIEPVAGHGKGKYRFIPHKD